MKKTSEKPAPRRVIGIIEGNKDGKTVALFCDENRGMPFGPLMQDVAEAEGFLRWLMLGGNNEPVITHGLSFWRLTDLLREFRERCDP